MRSLLLAPAGVGLTEVVNHLNSSADFEVLYVEHELLEKFDWESRTKGVSKKRNMRDLLRNVTRPELMSLWAAAFKACLAKLDESNAKNTILAFHPTIYSIGRSEQYSTVAWALAEGGFEGVRQVVLLIDDFMDMWERLSRDEEDIFFHPEWLRRKLDSENLDQLVNWEFEEGKFWRKPSPKPGNRDIFSFLVADSSQAIISKLLAWRHLDMVEAESFASVVRVPLTTLGVKHPYIAFEKLLSGDSEKTVYLSHPIKHPRSSYAENGCWPEIVEEINSLSMRFADQKMVLVCPTAIDELRFAQPASHGSISDRNFQLTQRWPLIVNTEEAIHPTDTASDRISHIEFDVSEGVRGSVGSVVRTLETMISAEVPYRDHYLVAHTEAFYVFRPLYHDGGVSGGVQSEIEHWAALAELEPTRRALFVHSEDDLSFILEDELKPQDVYYQIESSIRKKFNVSNGDLVKDWAHGKSSRAKMLSGELPSLEAQVEARKSILHEIGVAHFFERLTTLLSDPWMKTPQAGVSIIEGTSPTSDELERHAAFIKKGNESAVSQDRLVSSLEKFLGETIVRWMSRSVLGEDSIWEGLPSWGR